MKRPEETEIANTLAKRMAIARTLRKLTQTELARRAGITQTAYSSYERGAAIPSIIAFYSIAKVLDVDMAWLLGLPEGEGKGPEI